MHTSHHRVIGLRLYPWVIFTPDRRAWFGLNPPMGKGDTMRETSQLGGEKVIYRCPRTTRRLSSTSRSPA